MNQPKKTGRPLGAKTADMDLVDAVATRCKVCASTARTKYTQTQIIEGDGIAPDGRPYTKVTLRRTCCVNCGQHRIDRWYECKHEE